MKEAHGHRHERNELARLFTLRFGNLSAVADVELGGRSALDLRAYSSQSAAENQPRSRHSLFHVLERLDRGSCDALSALVGHDHKRIVAPLLVRCERRSSANPRSV